MLLISSKAMSFLCLFLAVDVFQSCILRLYEVILFIVVHLYLPKAGWLIRYAVFYSSWLDYLSFPL